MADKTKRAKILERYGLPDAELLGMTLRQRRKRVTRVRLSFAHRTVNMSTGHLLSFAHEIESVDQMLSDKIRNLLQEVDHLGENRQ